MREVMVVVKVVVRFRVMVMVNPYLNPNQPEEILTSGALTVYWGPKQIIFAGRQVDVRV